MAHLTLREAADAVGTSKSTLFRAIRNGRLSATRDDDGNFRVDPAELFRVYEPANSERSTSHRATPRVMTQDALAPDTELKVRCASLEAEVQGLKQMVEELRRARDKADARNDEVLAQVTLALRALPAPETKSAPEPERRPWWRRLAG